MSPKDKCLELLKAHGSYVRQANKSEIWDVYGSRVGTPIRSISKAAAQGRLWRNALTDTRRAIQEGEAKALRRAARKQDYEEQQREQAREEQQQQEEPKVAKNSKAEAKSRFASMGCAVKRTIVVEEKIEVSKQVVEVLLELDRPADFYDANGNRVEWPISFSITSTKES